MDLLPLFLNLAHRRVVLVGDERAAAKRDMLIRAGADVHDVRPGSFEPADLDGAWLVVTFASPDVNARVAREADARHVFVNAVDDPPNATAYLGGVLRRGGVTVAISTNGEAPGLAGLLREALDALLPQEIDRWMDTARDARREWKTSDVPMAERRPKLLEALNALYRV